MRSTLTSALALAVLAAGCALQSSATEPTASAPAVAPGAGRTIERPAPTRFAYPDAPRVEQVDDYHGVKIADPYRWLEDPDAAASRLWIEKQNELTQGYLGDAGRRGAIHDRLKALWDFERYSSPRQEGGKYFFLRNDGLQNQSVLFVADSLAAEPRALLDPNTLSADGTVSLGSWNVTDDGKLLAYSTSDGGSDWVTFRVRDVATGLDLPDVVKWAKFTGASWTKDGKGFFYSRYDEPQAGGELENANYYQKLHFHRIGTDQSQDVLVLEDKENKDWGFSGSVSDDGSFLIVSVWKGTERRNQVFYKDLTRADAPVVKLIDRFEAQYNFVDNEGPVLTFFTDLDAPMGRVIAIDTRSPDKASWRELIPQSDSTLTGVGSVGGQLLASYLRDAKTEVRAFEMSGRPVRTVQLPGIGTAGGFGGKKTDTETFYSFTNFNTPGAVYRYDIATGKSELWKAPKIGFDPAQYQTKQVFYSGKDGARIPMFIVHRTDLKLSGDLPTLLYGYGGFNQSITPTFSVANLVWMEMGGVLAVANIRGGGEYGKKWHDAGRLANKQNCFDDFIAGAEWLIASGYTNPKKLAIHGRSNGGLLVGACLNQRPELFGAAIPGVGVMDMLRFHKFTIGWAWVSDYGSPDDPEQFKALRKYSPLHNIREGVCYPPTLIITADHDDRVVPAHSFKYAAALQKAQACDNPILIRIETRAGHGAGKPTSKQIEEWADIWAFLIRALDVQPASRPG